MFSLYVDCKFEYVDLNESTFFQSYLNSGVYENVPILPIRYAVTTVPKKSNLIVFQLYPTLGLLLRVIHKIKFIEGNQKV